MLSLLVSIGLPALANDKPYRELPHPVPTADSGKVEVLEFFWYGCPHCHTFEPFIAEWDENKPDNVSFKRVAAPLNPSWSVHSYFYYTAESLGLLEQLHNRLFDALNKEGRRKELSSKENLIKFAVAHGADEAKFRSTWDSFFVKLRVEQATKLAGKYQLSGVPSVAVNGKYVTSASIAGGYPEIIKTIDQLVQTESENPAVATP